MSRPDYECFARLHEDVDLFREAVTFTSAQTGFSTRLIEKDYFCTLTLHYLAAADNSLVFKGGTCLAKVHTDFYRLSEDLDFVIPTPCEVSRSTRSRKAAVLKMALANLPDELAFDIVDPVKGANDSRQYLAVLGYTSVLSGQKETIKIEVALREPLQNDVLPGSVRTSLLNPITGGPMLREVTLPCISLMEAMSEKLRAALSRREAEIRDFFDIDYAVRKLGIDPEDAALISSVRQKLTVPGNGPVDVSDTRFALLRRQLDTRLKPVLRAADFEGFDLENGLATVARVAALIAEGQR